jgi:hypothetical protein
MKETCTGHNRQGVRCGKPPVPGGKVCRLHGGAIPIVAAKAIVRAEVAKWGLQDITEDPGEVLLRLVTQSSRRAALYASLLEEQYERAAAGEETTTLPSRIGVLIGRKFALNKEGRPVPVEEAIRGLVELEMRERELCGSFASKAIAAGLAERQVRIAERMGAAIADVLRAVLADPALGLTPTQMAAAPDVFRTHLGLTGAPLAIEGNVE